MKEPCGEQRKKMQFLFFSSSAYIAMSPAPLLLDIGRICGLKHCTGWAEVEQQHSEKE